MSDVVTYAQKLRGEIDRLRAENDRLTRCIDGADDMLAIMLANIDHAMTATDAEPAIFHVGPSELAAWAEAVQNYETARFPGVSDE